MPPWGGPLETALKRVKIPYSSPGLLWQEWRSPSSTFSTLCWEANTIQNWNCTRNIASHSSLGTQNKGSSKLGILRVPKSLPEYSFNNSKLNNWQFILRALTLFIISQSCNFCYKSAHITWLGSGSKWWLHTKTRTIQWRQLGRASPCTSLTRQSTAQFSHQSIVCFKIQYREITCQLE